MNLTFPVETVRLDAESKKQLSMLKRRTGIGNWNILCRWAFCLSMADPNPPRDSRDRGGNAVEMTWKTFAGDEDEIYRLMLLERCSEDHGSVDREIVSAALKQHLARGIARLVADRSVSSIEGLVALSGADKSSGARKKDAAAKH